jgi:hypothetical protein
VAQGARQRNYLIRNQTPRPIQLRCGSDSLALAPLQTRRVGAKLMESLGDAPQQAHAKQEIEWEPEPLRSRRLMAAGWLSAIGFATALLGGVADWSSGNRILLSVGAGVTVACVVAGVYVVGQGRESTRGFSAGLRQRAWLMWTFAVAAVLAFVCAVMAAVRDWPLVLVVFGFILTAICAMFPAYASSRRPKLTDDAIVPKASPGAVRNDVWGVVRDWLIATAYGFVAVLVVLVGVAVPAAATYYGTNMSSLLILHGWHHPTLVPGAHAQRLVVGRLLQIVLLIVVSLVPALMFFQFDREKLSTLVDRWLHAIFRLDRSLETIADVDAKYGRRVEEFYGATLGLGVAATRKRMRDRSPVVIATFLIAFGWIVVLLDRDAQTLDRNPQTVEPVDFQVLLQVSPSLITLAFLGAYFLSIQVTLRGYVRGDLKPKTYNVIIVRTLMAMILALAMEAIWGTNTYTRGLAFLAGILPSTVLRIMREMIEQLQTQAKSLAKGLSRRSGDQDSEAEDRKARDELREKSPLSELDDVDIYDRTRLEEEGITSVQALARHDLIDLILSSRIPVPRLVDWMDQAVLHQHANASLRALKRIGIRTATDYIEVYQDKEAQAHDALVQAASRDPAFVASLDVLYVVLKQDQWVEFLLNWRNDDRTETARPKVYRCTRAAGGSGGISAGNGHLARDVSASTPVSTGKRSAT